MRPTGTPPALLALLLTPLVSAHPYPRPDTTAAPVAARGYDLWTTTWTETRTYTSTFSTHYPEPTWVNTGAPCVPPEGTGQIACGSICCAAWQYCAYDGQCVANEGANSYSEWTTVGVITTQYSAPYRVTSGSTVIESTPTGTADSATTTPTGTPTGVPAGTAGSQLSGGAIAGIVIGSIAGVALLLLCCFCCIVRGLFNTIMGIFGLGKKKHTTERIEVHEERYSRHGSAHAAARPQHRKWFGVGAGGGRPSTVSSRKEKKSGHNWGWLAGGATAAALLFGLRRDNKHKAGSRPPRSDWSSSYYTDSYTASSPSSLSSSDRRTRDTRRSRQSRATRTSRQSRPSRH
jgi:hypothetical protein